MSSVAEAFAEFAFEAQRVIDDDLAGQEVGAADEVGDEPVGGPSLLLAEDVRPDVSGSLGQVRGAGRVHRLQPDVPATVRARVSRDAAPLSHVSTGISDLQRHVDRWGDNFGGWVRTPVYLLPLVAKVRKSSWTKSMAGKRFRVGIYHLSTANREFRNDTNYD